MNVKKGLSIILIAAVGGFTAMGISSLFQNNNNNNFTTQQQADNHDFVLANHSSAAGTLDFTDAAEKTVNAVVHVKTTIGARSGQPATIYDFFFGNPGGSGSGMLPMQATGSGVIISSDGYIVTNNHVVRNASDIEVVLNDERSFKAKLIGSDPATDIALLKIDANQLAPVSYGNSDDLKIGEWVLAVGNPFNLTSTVTAGIVSAKGRNLNLLQENYAIESFIQTDAAVNPGNSGGALVNAQGELVGINTAIASKTGSYSGYSFAVPVSIVRKVVADLTEYGTVQRALLGVSIQNIAGPLAEKLNMEKPQGVYVSDVNKSSAAEDAGIEAEDIILKINDIAVNKVSQLQEQISKYRPGDKIKILVNRKGDSKEYTVTLKNSLGTISYVDKEVIDILGASFAPADDETKTKLGIANGVQVTDLGSGKLMHAGIQEGFIITGINRRKIAKIEDIQAELNHSKGGIFMEGIYPDGTTGYYAFGIE